jgi:urease beta subunit
MIPGEYFIKEGDIICNINLVTATVLVTNTGDRPVQIGSHFHFFEVNSELSFDREKALGMRLNVASGTGVRFEPGEEKKVELVAFGGKRIIQGFNNLVNADLNQAEVAEKSIENAINNSFKTI